MAIQVYAGAPQKSIKRVKKCPSFVMGINNGKKNTSAKGIDHCSLCSVIRNICLQHNIVAKKVEGGLQP